MDNREKKLIEYSEQFKTQGNRDGKYWFLGIEEGGGSSVDEVDAMLAKWERNDKSDDTALRDTQKKSKPSKWFDANRRGGAPIQKTWGAQIRVLLSMQGLPSSTEDVRQYQMDHFGLADGDTCLMELLPLPNPGLQDWIYNDLSDDPRFESRQALADLAMTDRLERLVKLVEMHRPTCIVGFCYSFRHKLEPYLDNVSTVKAQAGSRPGRAKIGNIGETVVAITYHPATPMTAPNAWYAELGQHIAKRSNNLEIPPLTVQLQLPFAA